MLNSFENSSIIQLFIQYSPVRALLLNFSFIPNSISLIKTKFLHVLSSFKIFQGEILIGFTIFFFRQYHH